MLKKKSLFFLMLFPTFVAFFIFTGAYFYSSTDTPIISPPAYEEIDSVKTDLNEKVKNVDYAVYESLYRSQTRKRDIFFQNVEHRHQNGNVWDFTEIYIKCPDGRSVGTLHKTITADLKALGPEISHKDEKTPGGGIICNIFVEDFYTHKIVLELGGKRLPLVDARPKLAIIIDDLGYDPDLASSFVKLDMPLSLSVLPSAPYTDLIVREANEKGCELILHLPMEPKHYPSVNPGPGALFLSMNEKEVVRMLQKDLSDIPNARGVNNHMGSSFTEDRDKMMIVLKELKKRNLFFVDSRTTRGTVGLKLARTLGVPAAKRSVFLDNDLEPKAIKIQMERLLSMARHSGSAIGIGHPHKETLEVLEDYCDRIKNEFQVVLVSELVS